MKNLILILALFCSTAALGQMVPDTWEEDLKARHPRASAVNWVSGEVYYTAEFQEGDRKMEAYYTQQGEWIKTQMEVPLYDLPESLTKGVDEAYKIKSAAKIVSGKVPLGTYILQLEARFNRSGELLKDQ